jgi:hypothetical protein
VNGLLHCSWGLRRNCSVNWCFMCWGCCQSRSAQPELMLVHIGFVLCPVALYSFAVMPLTSLHHFLIYAHSFLFQCALAGFVPLC